MAAARTTLVGHKRVSETLQYHCGLAGELGRQCGIGVRHLVGKSLDGAEAQPLADLAGKIMETGSDGRFDRVS